VTLCDRRSRIGCGARRPHICLTADEAAAFFREMAAVIDKYEIEGRDAAVHPVDTRRVTCVLAIVPETSYDRNIA
jgi:hypothetical protein